jgi:ABC-type dipeptide/oligopeptide/nickel transport system ATPase subunit
MLKELSIVNLMLQNKHSTSSFGMLIVAHSLKRTKYLAKKVYLHQGNAPSHTHSTFDKAMFSQEENSSAGKCTIHT